MFPSLFRFATLLFLVATPVIAGCSPQEQWVRPSEVPTGPACGPTDEQGKASYYSDRLAGHPTASGAPYEPGAFTAAHRTLRLGTLVEVVRLDSGARVRVLVNDRGPFKAGRVVDLSSMAADALDMKREGIVDVCVRVL